MRITVVTPVFPTSAEGHRGIYICNIVRSLQRHADVDVICSLVTYPRLPFVRPPSMPNGQVDVHFAPGGVHVQYVKYPGLPVITRPFNSVSCCTAIEPHIRSLNPDLILAYWAQPEGLAAIAVGRELGVPVIVGALGSDILLGKGIGKYLAKRAVRRADRVLTVSGEMRRAAIRLGVSADRVVMIPNGCDSSVFYPRDRDACRRKLGVHPSTRLVLFAGRLTPMKGLPELVTAFAHVRQESPDAQLVCIGDGSVERYLTSPGQSDCVRALGPKTSEEIADWLGACDLFCLPSRSEGCPNVVVEALNCGRPVIGTQVGGIPAMVDDRSGILVPPRDVAKLASALREGLDRKWDKSAIAERMRRSWNDVADETYSVCLEVLNERRHAVPSNAGYLASGE